MTGLNTLWLVQVKHRVSDLWQPLRTGDTACAYVYERDALAAVDAMAGTHPGWDYRAVPVEVPS